MKWKTIDLYQRKMQTVAGNCSVLECRLDLYKLSLNSRELECFNANGWDEAMPIAETKLLVRANEASSCEIEWKNNWTALTPLGVLTVKLWGDSHIVKLGNKVIHDIEIIRGASAYSLRLEAAQAFKDLTKNLAAELS